VPRESGFVEKIMKDSFGFIECCDRDDRLFFHFSEVTPRNQQLAAGDEVFLSLCVCSCACVCVRARACVCKCLWCRRDDGLLFDTLPSHGVHSACHAGR